MPKDIVVDLNVILDVLLTRKGFEASRGVIELGENGSHRLLVSAHIVTTFAYLLEDGKVPKQEIRRHIEWLLKTFSVVSVDNSLLQAALQSGVTDYEDAVIEQAALQADASSIITRNIKDFKASRIVAVTPEAYLA